MSSQAKEGNPLFFPSFPIVLQLVKSLWSDSKGKVRTSAKFSASGIAYFASLDDSVYAVSAGTGADVWSFQTKSTISYTPALVGDTVYIASGVEVYAFK